MHCQAQGASRPLPGGRTLRQSLAWCPEAFFTTTHKQGITRLEAKAFMTRFWYFAPLSLQQGHVPEHQCCHFPPHPQRQGLRLQNGAEQRSSPGPPAWMSEFGASTSEAGGLASTVCSALALPASLPQRPTGDQLQVFQLTSPWPSSWLPLL